MTMRFATGRPIAAAAILSMGLAAPPVRSGELTPASAVGAFAQPVHHRKVDPALVFAGPEVRQEAIVCLLDEEGLVPSDPTTIQLISNVIDPRQIVDSFGHDTILATLTAAEVLALADDPRVEMIGANLPIFHTSLPDSILLHNAVAAWQLQANGFGLTGQGHSICIIDTGINFSHEAMAAKNIVGCHVQCVQPAGNCLLDCGISDCNGHGTRMSGIAASDGLETQGIGVGADLIALKVYTGCSGSGATAANIRRALDWAAANVATYDISVVSMSLGDGTAWAVPCDNNAAYITLRNGVDNCNAVGIFATAAAGNQGFTTGINAPACLSNTIGVGAARKDDLVWPDSNRGPTLKLFGIGHFVFGPVLSGGYNAASGTSLSTPMVSGALTIVRQFLDGLGETKTTAELEQLFFDTGNPLINIPAESFRQIDIRAAIDALIDELVTPGDLNFDGQVGIVDLLALLGAWGPCVDCADCLADLDGDCSVGIIDLLVTLGNWT